LVYVHAQVMMAGGTPPFAVLLTVEINDMGLDARAALATKALLDNNAAAEQQQRLNKAKRQAAPGL
jgi:hypothetical protein